MPSTSIQMTKSRVFLLSLSTTQGNCFKVIIGDDSILWHLRYDHQDFIALKLWEKNRMLKGIPQIECSSKIYETYMMSKHARKMFKERNLRRVS